MIDPQHPLMLHHKIGGVGGEGEERERDTHTHMGLKLNKIGLDRVLSHVFGAKLSSRWSIRILHDEVWWTWENCKPLQGGSDSKRKEVVSSGFLMMGGELGQWDSRFYFLCCSNEKRVIISLKCWKIMIVKSILICFKFRQWQNFIWSNFWCTLNLRWSLRRFSPKWWMT
jgi:hypothetical protein